MYLARHRDGTLPVSTLGKSCLCKHRVFQDQALSAESRFLIPGKSYPIKSQIERAEGYLDQKQDPRVSYAIALEKAACSAYQCVSVVRFYSFVVFMLLLSFLNSPLRIALDHLFPVLVLKPLSFKRLTTFCLETPWSIWLSATSIAFSNWSL
jgi:hypothetical protein